MVLKNSKYDKQAKWKYMAKHGLLPKKQEKQVQPKWSSKKKSAEQEYMKLDIDEMTSDWDSDVDEDIINYFYPSIGELEEIPVEQKRKIKRQVIEDLKVQRDKLFNEEQAKHDESREDGIYLGTEGEEPMSQVRLNEFIPEIPISKKKNRKLPINKDEGDVLEEYGINDYKETIKKSDDDYDALYKKKLAQRKLDTISNEELVGFKIGESSLLDVNRDQSKSKPVVLEITEEELEQERQRQAKSEQQRFFSQIKSKFSDQSGKPSENSKVIELNNYNADNSAHMDYFNRKLQSSRDKGDSDIEDDLQELLGISTSKSPSSLNEVDNYPDDLDALLNDVTIKDTASPPTGASGTNHSDINAPADALGNSSTQKKVQKPAQKEQQPYIPKDEEAFLDDLLG